uniref:Uncharacterized protein n=1 Tax=Phlebia radiata TaxID=5308 RepID=L8B9A0_PHLRA|nr:hypothetical protein PRA_mt0007 [Phlebia radiata]CCE89161.1 hypothetical protein PRA_mt0007 [Phlebia radiata]
MIIIGLYFLAVEFLSCTAKVPSPSINPAKYPPTIFGLKVADIDSVALKFVGIVLTFGQFKGEAEQVSVLVFRRSLLWLSSHCR